MHTNFRLNPQFFSLSHHRAHWPTSRTFLQSLLFAVGCLLLMGLFFVPSFAQPIAVSDQKPGSVLVFPYYNTIGTNDTRIAISNVGEIPTTDQVIVHLFFLEGATCTPADSFICLTPNGGFTMLASEMDPNTAIPGLEIIPVEFGTPKRAGKTVFLRANLTPTRRKPSTTSVTFPSFPLIST